MNTEHSTEDRARKLVVEERMHSELVQSKMLERGMEEVDTQTTVDTTTKARELIVEERKKAAGLQETMQERSLEEIEQGA
jgi:hypothetical protein